MTAIRQEVLNCINDLPDVKLEALRPLLRLLIDNEPLIIETDLTEEEKSWVKEGRREYAANPQSFKPLRV
jgi:hypothetical protein